LAKKKVERTIYLVGDVEEIVSLEIIDKINKINKIDDEKENKLREYKRKPIKLYINSLGGYVYNMLGIIGAMQTSKTPIDTYVYGSAFSAALFIAVAGRKRYASKNAWYMYHDISTYEMDKLESVKESTKAWIKIRKEMDKNIIERTKITKETLKAKIKMKKDWHFSSVQAYKMRVVDEII